MAQFNQPQKPVCWQTNSQFPFKSWRVNYQSLEGWVQYEVVSASRRLRMYVKMDIILKYTKGHRWWWQIVACGSSKFHVLYPIDVSIHKVYTILWYFPKLQCTNPSHKPTTQICTHLHIGLPECLTFCLYLPYTEKTFSIL